MPKKSIREMNIWERMRHSLSAKLLNVLVILALVIGVSAIATASYLFGSSINREYRTMTWNISKTASHAINKTEAHREAMLVIYYYDTTDEDVRVQEGEEYLAKFEDVYGTEFEALRKTLHDMTVENNAKAAYIAAVDVENNRLINICDGDQGSTFVPPGALDRLKPEYTQAFLGNAKPSMMDTLYGAEVMPAIVGNIENYGYRCTACTKIFDVGGYPVFVFFDTDMNHLASVNKMFILNYVLLLLIVTFIVGFIIIKRLQKTVVAPINALADAAKAYSLDKEAGVEEDTSHFQNLGIHTGDEIENLSLTMKDMENDIQAYVKNLTKVTAEKERISAELNVASQIQLGIIPHAFPPFPDRTEIDIFASMTPAKEVGGDFYDFFFIDDDHLALVIADVSGKGVPAALFMMASMIMIKNIAKLEKGSPAKILTMVNDQISANNEAEMFLTAWLGILEISSGKLRAANAGHEYPMVRHKDGGFELYKDPHGFVIGGMEGMIYKEYEIDLEPGDVVFQYTDGVTEATNLGNELFGTDRVLEALNKGPQTGSRAIIENMSKAIETFVEDASQFDDITMLCMKYKGR